MRVYLDLCCYNRPFDDQSQLRIRIEAEAMEAIQQHILDGRLELVWSYMLDYENSASPIPERRDVITLWRRGATLDIDESSEVVENSQRFRSAGVRSKDALHLACAVAGRCDYFLTTDDFLMKRASGLGITVMNPAQFIMEVLEC